MYLQKGAVVPTPWLAHRVTMVTLGRGDCLFLMTIEHDLILLGFPPRHALELPNAQAVAPVAP